jgi:xanthine dehydrogenase accessory factor
MSSNHAEILVPAPADAWPAWPTYGLIDDLLPVLARWRDGGERAALATLVHITGSSPRPLGSEMAVSANGAIAGYVSGGCVEGAVATEARAVLASGRPVWLDYGAGSPVLDVQLTCGGRIGIFVRALPDLAVYVERLQRARAERVPLTVTIDLKNGRHDFNVREKPQEHCFHQSYLPPSRLLIAGGDPVTLALARLAPRLGFEVGLLRPYGPSAPPEGVSLFTYDPRPLTRALADLALDEWTAVYTLTHDIDADHAILVRALRSPAFAIGALGSRSKIDERVARLRAAGLNNAQLARLNTPAGLDINAREPSEIALSVLAELVSQRPRARAISA